jgi:hypothetical protein
MSSPSPSQNKNNLEDDNARLDLINTIVSRSSNKSDNGDKNLYYNQQLPKVPKFSLEDCIDRVLNGDSAPSGNSTTELTGLRSFETVDLDALTRGFDQEEVKDGKLVLYITENQLLQLLKQRAIIVPNSKSLSSHDFSKENLSLVDKQVRSRTNTSLSQVELVVEDERAKSSLTAHTPSISEGTRASAQQNQDCNENDNQATGSSLSNNNANSIHSAYSNSLYNQDCQENAEQISVHESYRIESSRNTNKSQEQQQPQSSRQDSDLSRLKLVDSFIDRVLSRRSQNSSVTPAPSSSQQNSHISTSQSHRQSESRDTTSTSQQTKTEVEIQVATSAAAESEKPTSSTRTIRHESSSSFHQQKHQSTSQLHSSSNLAGRPTGHKIIIKTVRNLGQKVSTSSQQKAKAECRQSSSQSKVVKKTITYSYLDGYKPTTKVYEVIEPSGDLSNAERVKDLFSAKGQQSYVLTQFDPNASSNLVAENLTKPSTQTLNSYLSVHNTGVKNSTPVQVHPLVGSKADLKSSLSSHSTSKILIPF